MNDANGKPLSPSDEQELLQFFAWAYWIVGGLCFYWETIVFATLLRVSPEVELPLLGKCGAGEAIVFTLTYFWPVLLVAHKLVFAHQSYSKHGKFSWQFPGVLGDKEIPRTFGRLRPILFVILVVWPTFVHVVLTVRAFTHMKIVLNVGGAVYAGQEYEKWSALGWLQKPSVLPVDPQSGERAGEWRWLHWRDSEKKSLWDLEKERFVVKLVDQRGKQMAIKPDENGKPIELVFAEIPETTERKAGAFIGLMSDYLLAVHAIFLSPEVKKMIIITKSKHWVTALPIVQPWGFVIAALGFIVSIFWLTGRAAGRTVRVRAIWKLLVHEVKRTKPKKNGPAA